MMSQPFCHKSIAPPSPNANRWFKMARSWNGSYYNFIVFLGGPFHLGHFLLNTNGNLWQTVTDIDRDWLAPKSCDRDKIWISISLTRCSSMATILYYSLEANTSLLQSPYIMYIAWIKRDFHILQYPAVSPPTKLSLLRNCQMKYGKVEKWLKNPQD